MLIKITKTHHRALDCRTVVELEEGSVVGYEGEIASNIIDNGYGVEHIEQKALDVKIENKAIDKAPENKSIELPIEEEVVKPVTKEIKETSEKIIEEVEKSPKKTKKTKTNKK